jgi:uncharacterized protein (DUF433 family)
MPLKKWSQLDKNPAICGGRIRIDGTRLTTEHVYRWCAGSDSDDHIKDFQKNWSYVSADAIKQAIAFEKKRRVLPTELVRS